MRALVILGLLASAPVAAQVRTQIDRMVIAPAAGEVSTAAVGEVLWRLSPTSIETTSIDQVALGNRIKIGNLMKGLVIIPQDSQFTTRTEGGALVACTRLNMAFGRRNPCLYDRDRDGKFEGVSFTVGNDPEPLPEQAAYTVRKSSDARFVGPDFHKEVSFLGSNGQSLTFGYREFVGQTIRPAFSETLVLPLSPSFPQKLRVKGIIFTVRRIDGLGIEYEIDKGSPDLVAG